MTPVRLGDPLEADWIGPLPDPVTVSLPFAWQTKSGWQDFQGPVDLDLAFSAPPWQGRTDLVCEGSFYASEWELDGHGLGHHEGYIAPFRRDITDILKQADNPQHHLHVRLGCPPEPEHLHKHLMTGIFSHWDCLPESYNPGGIWRATRLEPHMGVRIDGLWLRTLALERHEALTEIRGRVTADRDGLFVITARLRPLPHAPRRPVLRTTVTAFLPAGESELALPLTVPEPLPWMPREWMPDSSNGRAPRPALYELFVQVVPTSDSVASPGTSGRRAYRITRHVGIRTVERTHSGQLRLNGRPLFVRGMNYAPSGAYLADATPQMCWADVREALDTGLNALRVHAHLDRPALYRAADRLGLVLFQDGPLQWMYDAAALATAPAHLSALVDRLMGHPSVLYLAVHNEPVTVVNPAESGLAPRLRALSSVFVWSENRDLWDRALARDLRRKVDRHLIVSSQSGVLPRLPGADVHLYMGWYSDFGPLPNLDRLKRLAPWTLTWVTEFGAQSLPSEETSRTFIPEEPTREDWETLGKRFMAQVSVLEDRVGVLGVSRREAIRRTQTYQAALDVAYIDRLRASKYAPVAGFFAFVWADAALGITWSHLDQNRLPKLAVAALREALTPVTVTALLPLSPPAGRSRVTLPLVAVNDTAWPLTLEMRLQLEPLGSSIESPAGTDPGPTPDRVLEVRLEPDSRADMGSFSLPAQALTEPGRLKLTWQASPTGPAAYAGAPTPPAHGVRTYTLPWAAWGKAWLGDEANSTPAAEDANQAHDADDADASDRRG